jgi:hypothetical protein
MTVVYSGGRVAGSIATYARGESDSELTWAVAIVNIGAGIVALNPAAPVVCPAAIVV